MQQDYLQMLAQIVLPAQILDYFIVSGVEQTTTAINITLDEKINQELSNDENYVSKGFMDAVSITDFPIRDHKVILRDIGKRQYGHRIGTNEVHDFENRFLYLMCTEFRRGCVKMAHPLFAPAPLLAPSKFENNGKCPYTSVLFP